MAQARVANADVDPGHGPPLANVRLDVFRRYDL
jgi:hypothetical protein